MSDFLYNPGKTAWSNELNPPPISTPNLVRAWKNSSLYKVRMGIQNLNPMSLETSFSQAQYGKRNVHSVWDHIKLLIDRQFILMQRNKQFLFLRMFSAIIMVF